MPRICILGSRITGLCLAYGGYCGLILYWCVYLLRHRPQQSHILPQFRVPLQVYYKDVLRHRQNFQKQNIYTPDSGTSFYTQSVIRLCNFVTTSEFESRQGKDFSSFHFFHNGSGAHPASYPMSTASSFLGGG
jgi:hypothetical protein